MQPLITRRALIRTAALGGAGAAVSMLAACSAEPSGRTVTTPTTDRSNRTLLVYFSRAGENYWNGGRRVLKTGNTERLASLIADQADVTTWRIEAEDSYPDGYDATVRRNSDEQDRDVRPAIAADLPDLDGYDTLLLGSPIWNVRPPMIMTTFLESVDLTGMRVLPFVTYAVSGAGQTRATYEPLIGSGTLTAPLAVRGEEVADAGADVGRWLTRHELGS